MATKKLDRKDDSESEAGTETGTLPGVGADSEAESELEEVALKVPQGAIGTLYRFLEGGKKAWCDELGAADFSPQWIRDRFGPGNYRVYWRAPDPKRPGKTTGAGSTPIMIQATGVPGAPNTAGSTSRLDTTMATLVEEHVKRMLDGQDMLQKMQLAVLTNLTKPQQSDGFSEVLKLILPELIKSLVNRPTPAGPDLAGIIALADKLSNRASPVTAMKDTLALLEQARELAGGGDGEGTPAWVTLAARALDTIGRAVSQKPAELEAIPGVTTPAPTALPAPAPAGPTLEVSPLPSTAHAVFHFLSPHMPMLLRHAIADHDPTTYAGVIFDQVDPQYLAEVRDYISRPDFLDLLEANFPTIRGPMIEGSDPPAPVREWFTELRDDLVTRIQDALNPPAAEVH